MTTTRLINERGNAANNQYVTTDGALVHFTSYTTHIATINRETKEIEMTTYWDYSRTTLKYTCQFLRRHAWWLDIDKKASIEKAIKNGQIKIKQS